MSPNPSTSPTAEAGNTLEALTRPHGPTDTEPSPLHTEAVSDEPAPASSPKHLTRDDWVRIAIFGIPLRVVFPARHHPDIDLPHVMERHPRQRHTRLDFPGDGAGIFWTRGPLRILVPA